jgi:hypothetical protein
VTCESISNVTRHATREHSIEVAPVLSVLSALLSNPHTMQTLNCELMLLLERCGSNPARDAG